MGEAQQAGSAFGVPVSFPLGAMGSRPGTLSRSGARSARTVRIRPAHLPSMLQDSAQIARLVGRGNCRSRGAHSRPC